MPNLILNVLVGQNVGRGEINLAPAQASQCPPPSPPASYDDMQSGCDGLKRFDPLLVNGRGKCRAGAAQSPACPICAQSGHWPTG